MYIINTAEDTHGFLSIDAGGYSKFEMCCFSVGVDEKAVLVAFGPLRNTANLSIVSQLGVEGVQEEETQAVHVQFVVCSSIR